MSKSTLEVDIFGDPISSYSRAQAIEDGELVDISDADGCKGHFRFAVAMTRAAWMETIAAGGVWIPENDGDGETLKLPAGQSIAGRMHDICTMIKATMRNPRLDPAQARNTRADRVYFSVLVDKNGNGKPQMVELWDICGPGDTPDPVFTIMLRNEN